MVVFVSGPWLTGPVTAWGLDLPELAVAALSVLLLLAADLLSLKRGLRGDILALPRALRWALVLALLAVVLVFGVYGTGYDPQDFIYFKF